MMVHWKTCLSAVRARARCAAAVVTAGLVAAVPDAGAATELHRGPCIQNATPTSIVIVWRTEGAPEPMVRYTDAGTGAEGRSTAAATTVRGGGIAPEDGGLAGAPASVYQVECRLDGLTPGTVYRYAVYDGDRLLAGESEDYFFTTSPAPGAAHRLRFWAVGDTGTGGRDQAAAYAAVRTYCRENNIPIDLFVHTGDVAYQDGLDREFQENHFAPYEDLLRNTVCWPSFGNHDGHSASGITGIGPYFDAFVLPAGGEAGGVPSGTESYYGFTVGRVHFLALNMYDEDRTPEGRMADWIRRDLDALDNVDWVIAFFHHPPYSKGSHDSDTEARMVEVREWLMPILDAGGVDLVLCGHSHTYERSMLITGAYDTPSTAHGVILDDRDGDPDGQGAYRKSAGTAGNQGTIHVVAGIGGGGLNRIGDMPLMKTAFTEFGGVLVDIDGDTLTCIMVNLDGEIRDRFAIVKQGTVEQAVISAPWQALGPTMFPDTEWFLGETVVTIDSPTRWTGEVITYTLDGTEPDENAARYEGPIAVTESTTIKARACQPDSWRVSPVTTKVLSPYEDELMTPVTLDRDAMDSGLRYQVYRGDWSEIPDFRGEPPVSVGTAHSVSAAVTPLEEQFGIVFEGVVDIPHDDVYRFVLNSDDGSRVTVDGRVVVDHDGLHAATPMSGYAGLREGPHDIRIDFFEQSGDQSISLAIYDAKTGATVPVSRFAHRRKTGNGGR